MNSYNQAMSAYAQSAGEINDNLGRYRSDVDQVDAANKQLRAADESKIDLDALRGLGEEMGVRAFKGAVAKYGGQLYKYKIPKLGKSLGDLDRGGTDAIKNYGKNILKKTIGGAAEDSEVELSDIGIKGGMHLAENTTSRFATSRLTSSVRGATQEGDGTMNDNFEEEKGLFGETETSPETASNFEDFMNQYQTPETKTGDIDFDKINQDRNIQQSSTDAERGETKTSFQESSKNQDIGEEKSSGISEEPNVETGAGGDMDKALGDLNDTARSALNRASSLSSDPLSQLGGDGDAAAQAAKDAADALAKSALATGENVAGDLLDATGLGAIVGIPLQIAGYALEGGALLQAGKSIWDWFDDDILGNKPKIDSIAAPKYAGSIAQRGMLITPNMDTLDTQTSYGSF